MNSAGPAPLDGPVTVAVFAAIAVAVGVLLWLDQRRGGRDR